MPLFYQNNISENTKLAIWKIEESEAFFLKQVPLQRAITHPHKRLQHLAGRFMLQYLFPDFPFNEIVIADTRKPYLPYEQYHFSLSHCGNFAAAIVSKDNRVGIDIEIPAEKILRIQNKFLSEKELEFINKPMSEITFDNHPEVQYKFPTLAWSAKETIFKWWSYGNVDFREHLLLKEFSLASEGNIAASFYRSNEQYSLSLSYKLFDDLCLTWLNTDS